MTLCCDVVSVVVKYLKPQCLKNFWRDEGLDFGMKFVYGGTSWPLFWDEIDVCFGDFSRIILIGIGLHNSEHRMMGISIKTLMNKVMCCGIYDDYGMITNLCIVNYISEIIDIVKLKIVNCFAWDLSVLSKFKKLEYLIVTNEVNGLSSSLKGIDNCLGLKTLKIINLILNDDDFDAISGCVKLTHFVFEGRLHGECMLKCNSLKTLKLIRYSEREYNVIKKCPNLRNVHVVNCKWLESIFDINVVELCKELKYVKVRRCPVLRIDNIRVLKMNNVRVLGIGMIEE